MRDALDMAHRSSLEIPGDLRARLEVARLDLLALFRALDRMDLSAQEIPQRLLRQLFERDADYAEALWALDQVEGSLDRRTLLRDTLNALDQLPSATARFRIQLPSRAHPTLELLEASVLCQKSCNVAKLSNRSKRIRCMIPSLSPPVGVR